MNLLGYGAVQTFSTWQFSSSLTCPFPPCIYPLGRPIPQLGSINVYESEASSVYNGASIDIHRQMTHGLYFRLGYTYAHAVDDGQDALVAGRPGDGAEFVFADVRAGAECDGSAQPVRVFMDL